MPGRNEKGDTPSIRSLLGHRSACLAEGLLLLLQRMEDCQSARERASAISVGLTAPARTALVQMARQVSPRLESTEPGRFLLAVQTYYALAVKLVTLAAIERATGGNSTPMDALSECDLRDLEMGHGARRCGAAAFPDAPEWAWYLDVWDRPMETWLRAMGQRLQTVDYFTAENDPGQGNDLFGTFYMSLLPKQVRHSLGEHYTPPWLADHVLCQVGFDGGATGRLLDPTCGSGVFLLQALMHVRRKAKGQEEIKGAIGRVVGMDVNSLAVLAARANYLLALRDCLASECPLAPPIHLQDVVLQAPKEPGFDFVVGNPPWLGWDHLSDDYRRETKELWQHYGLFSLSGNEARHGGGKKDLAMLVLYAAADRYLRVGGRMGMVVTQTLFQTRGLATDSDAFDLVTKGVRSRFCGLTIWWKFNRSKQRLTGPQQSPWKKELQQPIPSRTCVGFERGTNKAASFPLSVLTLRAGEWKPLRLTRNVLSRRGLCDPLGSNSILSISPGPPTTGDTLAPTRVARMASTG